MMTRLQTTCFREKNVHWIIFYMLDMIKILQFVFCSPKHFFCKQFDSWIPNFLEIWSSAGTYFCPLRLPNCSLKTLCCRHILRMRFVLYISSQRFNIDYFLVLIVFEGSDFCSWFSVWKKIIRVYQKGTENFEELNYFLRSLYMTFAKEQIRIRV